MGNDMLSPITNKIWLWPCLHLWIWNKRCKTVKKRSDFLKSSIWRTDRAYRSASEYNWVVSHIVEQMDLLCPPNVHAWNILAM